MKRADKRIQKDYLKKSEDYRRYRDELRNEIIEQKAHILTQLVYDGLELPLEYSYLLECLRDELEYIEDDHKSKSN